MKSFFLILALFVSTDKALSQDKKPCFGIPQAVNLSELDNINLTNDCLITSFSFQLFNRWGEQVFQTNEYGVAWNGMFDEKKCQDGLYAYVLTYRSCANPHNAEKITGHVSLLK
jgi:gliding motility-associated-like protein